MAQVPLYFKVGSLYPVSEVSRVETQQNSMPVFRAILFLVSALELDGEARLLRAQVSLSA